MGIRTLLRYLIGDRDAILQIAASRRAFWLGLAFVLSAGFAREYDGEDLTAEPWHLVIPLAASLVSSLLLFSLLFLKVAWNDPRRPAQWSAYGSFLTLFWMTAPLAWLYAIPYERFLSPGNAVAANLYTLALVAAWRVVLMIRVAIVLMGYRPFQAAFLVIGFADVVALSAVYLMPKPTIFAAMGGIRLSEAEQAITGATLMVGCWGMASLPIWLIGGLSAILKGKPVWQVPAGECASIPDRGLWALAALSLAAWIPILPSTQAEQRLRHQAEHDLKAGQIDAALAFMSAHEAHAFPPLWDPPPRVGYADAAPHLLDVLDAMTKDTPAPWVREQYIAKLKRALGSPFTAHRLALNDAGRLAKTLRLLPEGTAIVDECRDTLEWYVRQKNLPKNDADALQALLDESRQHDATK
ncbi:MAG: hypothetical protein U0746_06490 [Gemmataceae bacterium]